MLRSSEQEVSIQEISDKFLDYHDIHFPGFHNPDHNMEGSSTSPPSTFTQWNPPSSQGPPYQFPSCKFPLMSSRITDSLSILAFPVLGEDLVSWSDPHSPQLFSPEMQFNEPSTGFHPTSYSDGYPQDPMTSPDTQLSDSNYFDNLPSTSGIHNFPAINIDEGSTSNAEQLRVVGNLAEFPSPFIHDAGTRGLPAGAIPGSLAEHEQPQEQLPLTGPYPRGYPMHSYESTSNSEDPDYKKNPEAMRNSWMANYSQFVDGSKVYKIFSKHAKEKVATINTIKASVARRRNPAKFKCSIQGCGADFTRKHNLESEFDNYKVFLSAHYLRRDTCHSLASLVSFRSLEVALRCD